MPTDYVYYQDPGHGWIAVTLKELQDLGIADQITHYSYILGPVVYLEEDCDAATWMRARRAIGQEPKLIDHYQDPTPIREYPAYRALNGIKRATPEQNAQLHQLGS